MIVANPARTIAWHRGSSPKRSSLSSRRADGMDDYDPRYLVGVLLVNAGDFFEAHEVWEDVWAESHDAERRFYQGLIHAAVGLCHFHNGNLSGAAKLYRSGRDYMSRCGSSFLGLDLEVFWR